MLGVLEYLENSAKKYPAKTAIADKYKGYSFAELKFAAQQMGATIAKTGIRNKPVAVFVNRNADVAVMFMGALYSGNYYVPIDPDMPLKKQQSILDDCGTKVILGSEDNRAAVEALEFSGSFLTVSDCGNDTIEAPEIADDTPLYMVYTSGSTGKPKGVLKSHGAVMSFVEAFVNTFGVGSEEILGNQTPFFFDASAKDFYIMLFTGATIEIIPTERFSLPTELMEYMNEKKITMALWVPTAISLVAQLCPFSLITPQHLSRLFFVGEVMPMKHLNKWRSYLPEIEYVNLYGQSELAGICCYYEVKGEFENSAVLPMGKPLGNCHIYLLDGDSAITEPDKIGEMYIASPALALEYYNDPEKTAACFMEKDFGNGIERCFKTGDLAQYDSSGNLIFAARSDFQIKHMGHRIELGEIEAVAGAMDEIDRCCCMYNAEKRKIVLFCQLSGETRVTGRDIQSMLRSKLSTYMLPGKVIITDKLPLSANGKIDRQKLKEQL